MKARIVLSLAAMLILSGCSAVSHAAGVVARPVSGLFNVATGPIRGLNN